LLPDFYSGATGLSGCFTRDFLSGALIGRIVDLGMAESVLADGAADMVGMMRALLADPFLILRARGRSPPPPACGKPPHTRVFRSSVAGLQTEKDSMAERAGFEP